MTQAIKDQYCGVNDTLIYTASKYVVGYGSEGRQDWNQLSNAGGSSGYSLGVIQTDFGARPAEAKLLLDAYNQYKGAGHGLTQATYDKALDSLTTKELSKHPDKKLDSTVKANLEAFMQTPSGATFVHKLDQAQIDEELLPFGRKVLNTPLANVSSEAEKLALLGIAAKIQNQRPVSATHLLNHLNTNSPETNTIDKARSFVIEDTPAGNARAAVKSGQDAVSGVVALMNKLDATNNHNLSTAWTYAKEHAQTDWSSPNHFMFKSMFIDAEGAKQCINKMEANQIYIRINSNEKLPNFACGKNSVLLVWDKNEASLMDTNGVHPINAKDVHLDKLPNGEKDVSVRLSNGQMLNITHPEPPVLAPQRRSSLDFEHPQQIPARLQPIVNDVKTHLEPDLKQAGCTPEQITNACVAVASVVEPLRIRDKTIDAAFLDENKIISVYAGGIGREMPLNQAVNQPPEQSIAQMNQTLEQQQQQAMQQQSMSRGGHSIG